MMISPAYYVSQHESDSFKELIAERKRLIKEIDDLEQIAYDEEHEDPLWQLQPNVEVQYQVKLEWLAELCRFIRDKYNRVIVWKEEEE